MTISAALLAALAAPTIAAMSDADAATALSTPTYTPRTTPITITTLGAAWGAPRAATVLAQLKTLAATPDATGILAGMVVDVLAGPGFDATNAAAEQTIAELVTAGICTQAEADAATGIPTYPLGAPLTAADVTAARAILPSYTAALAIGHDMQNFMAFAGGQIGPIIQRILAGETVAVPASIEAMLASWRAAP